MYILNLKILYWTSFIYFLLVLNSCITTSHTSLNTYTRLEKYTEEDLIIRSFIMEKYNPGLCAEMPSFTKKLSPWYKSVIRDERWITYLRQRFNIEKEYALYEKSEQMEKIKTTKTKLGYIVRFADGQCCIVKHFEGIVIIDNGIIKDFEIKEVKTRKVPC